MRTGIYIIIAACIIVSCKNNNSGTSGTGSAKAAVKKPITNNLVSNAPAAGLNTSIVDTTDELASIYNTSAENRQNIKAIKKEKAGAKNKLTAGYFPESSDRKLEERDVQYLSEWGRKLILNEIYARHGMIFTDESLKKHFRKQKWYRAKTHNVTKMLTKTEKYNIAFLINTAPPKPKGMQ